MTASKKKNQGLSMAGVYESRKLIARLSVNDFKTKFAGSYFGYHLGICAACDHNFSILVRI